jgi:5-carboxymethyl-2-hydroxymuconate isomerase
LPQIVIEYSPNITDDADSGTLLRELSAIAAAAGEIPIEQFKSRVVRREEYSAGTGGDRDAFVQLEVGVFSGKPPEVKRRIGEDCLEYLEEYYSGLAGELSLQITVEIREMEKESYFKTVIEKEGGQK